jgi:phage pi2 protein 07
MEQRYQYFDKKYLTVWKVMDIAGMKEAKKTFRGDILNAAKMEKMVCVFNPFTDVCDNSHILPGLA